MSEDKVRPWGAWLQQRREELGIDLEQAEEETRIRLRYLEALEAGDLESLPDPVVGRGFLRNYARYLELDLDEAARRFPEEFGQQGAESVPIEESSPFAVDVFRPVPLHGIAGDHSRRWLLVLLVVLLIVALAILAWWAYPSVAKWLPWQGETAPAAGETATRQVETVPLSTATHTPTATSAPTLTPAADETVAATPTIEITLTPTNTPTSSPSPSPSPPVYTGIFMELLFTDTSWIQVTVDGVRQFQGELEAETYRSWYGEERIELRIGNAGVVLVTVNGQSLGTLGEDGEVVDRVFEKVDDSVIEATVTPVITGTAPTQEATVKPTATSTSEPTAAPTSEATEPVTPGATVAPASVQVTVAPTVSPAVTLTATATITVTATVTTTATLTPTGTITPTASP